MKKINWTRSDYYFDSQKIVNSQVDINRAVHEINQKKIRLDYLKDCIDNAIENLNNAFIKKVGGRK